MSASRRQSIFFFAQQKATITSFFLAGYLEKRLKETINDFSMPSFMEMLM